MQKKAHRRPSKPNTCGLDATAHKGSKARRGLLAKVVAMGNCAQRAGGMAQAMPISLALPKLQGNADQVAEAAQGVKMDFWTTAKFVLLLLAGSAALRNIWRLPLPMGAKVASTMGLAVSLLWFVRYLMGYVQNT